MLTASGEVMLTDSGEFMLTDSGEKEWLRITNHAMISQHVNDATELPTERPIWEMSQIIGVCELVFLILYHYNTWDLLCFAFTYVSLLSTMN